MSTYKICIDCRHADYSGLTASAATSVSVCRLDGHMIAFFSSCPRWQQKEGD